MIDTSTSPDPIDRQRYVKALKENYAHSLELVEREKKYQEHIVKTISEYDIYLQKDIYANNHDKRTTVSPVESSPVDTSPADKRGISTVLETDGRTAGNSDRLFDLSDNTFH